MINADRFVAEAKFVRLRRCRDADVVMCCVSTKEEAGAWWLLKTVLQDGKLLAVSRVDGDTMEFYIIEDLNELEQGKFRFFEPLQQCRIYLSGGAELMTHIYLIIAYALYIIQYFRDPDSFTIGSLSMAISLATQFDSSTQAIIDGIIRLFYNGKYIRQYRLFMDTEDVMDKSGTMPSRQEALILLSLSMLALNIRKAIITRWKI